MINLSLFPEIRSERPDADESSAFLREQILTYIGNKRSLLSFIAPALNTIKERVGSERIVSFDVFSGSGIVARFLKQHSNHLIAGDLESYSFVVNKCYLSNKSEVDEKSVKEAIDLINNMPASSIAPGFIAELYAPKDDRNIKTEERVFYTRRNACFIDTARKVIGQLLPEIQPFVLAPLLYKASVHANTSGVFKGFYKNSNTKRGQFGGNGENALTRILSDIYLPYPVFSNHHTQVTLLQGDANQYIHESGHADVAYIDPPYNQHPYGSNYFMLNLIASNNRPATISNVSGIPTDWNRSAFNKRQQAHKAFSSLVNEIDAKYLMVSFSSEGFISYDEMISILQGVGHVESLETKYNAFRGSRNLGNRDIHVKEYLYLVEKK